MLFCCWSYYLLLLFYKCRNIAILHKYSKRPKSDLGYLFAIPSHVFCEKRNKGGANNSLIKINYFVFNRMPISEPIRYRGDTRDYAACLIGPDLSSVETKKTLRRLLKKSIKGNLYRTKYGRIQADNVSGKN